MRPIYVVLIGVLLSSAVCADDAPPYDKELFSDLTNWQIAADQWTLSKGVLSKKTLLYHGDKLLVLKEKAVDVPVWYSFGCDLVNVKRQNDKLPEAGIVFGYLNEKNYWSATIAEELSVPMMRLTRIKDGETAFCTSVPLPRGSDQEKMALRVEVHHEIFVKVFFNKLHVLTHMTADGIDRGRIGLALQSGICSFANAQIAGIAKR